MGITSITHGLTYSIKGLIMSTSITVFSSDSAVVFTTKKGAVMSISPEGALFKGGAALASLKDAALDSAMSKAANGRYQPIVDILELAFPKVSKQVFAVAGLPGLNKSNFRTFLGAIERAPEGKNGFTKRQDVAHAIVRALRSLPALAVETDERTIDMVVA